MSNRSEWGEGDNSYDDGDDGFARGETCLVIHPHLKSAAARDEAVPLRTPEARLEEIVGLAQAIELDIVAEEIVALSALKPGTYFGKGTMERLDAIIKGRDVGVVVVDAQLSPVQQRNLERSWKAKVLDRTGIILEIFGERARTKEGRLQVDLAHLTYQRSRLVRSWTHLERQRGGAVPDREPSAVPHRHSSSLTYAVKRISLP